MLAQQKLILVALFVGFALLLAGCGDDDSETDAAPTDGATQPESDDAADAEVVADDAADAEVSADVDGDLDEVIGDMVENLEDAQAAQGGGSATLVVGDQQWTFDSVLCAFGEDQIGQEGAVFNLSSIRDGLQVYASIDSYGHSVSLNDIEDFENPSVSLDAAGGEFITLDGKSITADAEFRDDTSESFDTIPGTFTATCP